MKDRPFFLEGFVPSGQGSCSPSSSIPGCFHLGCLWSRRLLESGDRPSISPLFSFVSKTEFPWSCLSVLYSVRLGGLNVFPSSFRMRISKFLSSRQSRFLRLVVGNQSFQFKVSDSSCLRHPRFFPRVWPFFFSGILLQLPFGVFVFYSIG